MSATDRETDRDEAFLRDFQSMSAFGRTPAGGVERQAATAEDGRLRSWFRGLMEANGFTVGYDAIGNQFALRELVPGAPYVFLGSHLDSQPRGGRFDGAYGVLAAAHAAMRLSERARAGSWRPSCNLAVVNWFNEEGSRFKPSMMGSSVFTGKLGAQEALATRDADGVTVAEALERIGTVDPSGGFAVPKPAAYLEIHIEQGRSLEDAGLTIGVVESTWGVVKHDFVVHGEQAHTGATRIADRRDALLGAALLVVEARRISERFSDEEHEVITSCGELTVLPNSPVVVAREVRLLVDLRCSDPERLAEADAELRRRIAEIEREASVRVEERAGHAWPAKGYGAAGVALARRIAAQLGLPHGVVRTLAGHDSTNLRDLVPTIMLFVPSAQGVSHSEQEFTSDEDMLAGLRMLTATLEQVAGGELPED